MEDYESNGSGWVVDHFLGVDLGIVTHDLLWASSYISTPKGLKHKKAIVIIKNSDQKCFIWSVLGKLYPQPNISHRVSPYERLEYNLGMAGIDYSIRTNDKKVFTIYPSIAVNIYGYEDEVIFSVRISDLHDRLHSVDLRTSLHINKGF